MAGLRRAHRQGDGDPGALAGLAGDGDRAAQGHGALAPADQVVRRIDPGPNPDPIVFGIFSVFEILLASVYTGMLTKPNFLPGCILTLATVPKGIKSCMEM